MYLGLTSNVPKCEFLPGASLIVLMISFSDTCCARISVSRGERLDNGYVYSEAYCMHFIGL